MIDILLIIFGLVGLTLASISDIKTREVPDWLNYSLIAIGLSFRAIYSINHNEANFFLYSLLGFGIVFILGSMMYYTKQWGGGDAKTFMAVAALFTIMPDNDFFLIHFTINLLIVGLMYNLLFITNHFIKNKKKIIPKTKKYFSTHLKSRIIIVIFFAVLSLIAYYTLELFLLYFISLFAIIVFYLFLIPILKIVEEVSLYKKIPPKKLTEGDWINQDIKYKKEIIYNKKSPGVTEDQIKKILKLNLKKVEVKEGIPFIPSFLFSLIVTLSFGNLIWVIF